MAGLVRAGLELGDMLLERLLGGQRAVLDGVVDHADLAIVDPIASWKWRRLWIELARSPDLGEN